MRARAHLALFLIGALAASEAQHRGHECWHYLPESLSWYDGCLKAQAHPIRFKMDPQNWFEKGQVQTINLNETDVILMRQDPPFDMHYITLTHLLEQISDQTLIVNDPVAVRNSPEKLMIMNYRQFLPPTLISREPDEIKAFKDEHHDIIVKPLFGNGGAGVFYLSRLDPNLPSLLEMFLNLSREPLMVQKFISNISKGDVRIILIDGEIAGAINRIPPNGQIRSNMHVGGHAIKTQIDQRMSEICGAIGSDLKKSGIILAGLDVIDGYLTEINVTSPTGIQEINHFDNAQLDKLFWEAVEKRF
ncbi:MAG: glutathione synthase [Pseudomonadota bacterium]